MLILRYRRVQNLSMHYLILKILEFIPFVYHIMKNQEMSLSLHKQKKLCEHRTKNTLTQTNHFRMTHLPNKYPHHTVTQRAKSGRRRQRLSTIFIGNVAQHHLNSTPSQKLTTTKKDQLFHVLSRINTPTITGQLLYGEKTNNKFNNKTSA